MHRQLLGYGGIQKLFPCNNSNSDDNYYSMSISAQKKKPTQQLKKKSQLVTKLPSKNAVSVKRKPVANDVICARGRAYWDHPGNHLYRKLISLAKNQYAKAPNRLGKSMIVSEIIRAVHNANGNFVKKVRSKGEEQWVECNLNFIREKVTQSLRDGLSFKYSSSTTRKRQRKSLVQEIFDGDIHRIVHSNAVVSSKINDLKEKVEWANRYRGTEGEGVSDEKMMDIFVSANLDILESMKKDPSMLEQLVLATKNEKRIGKKDQQIPDTSLSSTSIEPTAPETVRSQSDFFESSCSTTESLFSPDECGSKDDSSCSDDMEFDLDSPNMFLDDF